MAEEAVAASIEKRALSPGSVDLCAGITAGFFAKFAEYPFDTVKVLQQTMGSEYTSAADCLKKTYRLGGIPAFYRGLLSPLLGSMAECATLFVSYGFMKRLLDVDEAAPLARAAPMWKYCVSGAGSGVCVAFVLTPVELLKCRLQVQSSSVSVGAADGAVGGAAARRYAGPWDCLRQIVRTEGITGLWRGNASCLNREIVGNFAWFGVYEAILRAVQVNRGYDRKPDVPLAWCALAGSCAGVTYWLVPFPADTVKSKLQTDPTYAGQPFTKVFSSVVRKEGVRGLYRGAGITCARAAPTHALLFYVYEVAASFIRLI